jgi:hypothetical protein
VGAEGQPEYQTVVILEHRGWFALDASGRAGSWARDGHGEGAAPLGLAESWRQVVSRREHYAR